jgi:hypothetical protein
MENCISGRNLLRSAVILLCLVSCATTAKSSPFSPVYVTDSAKYTLLPPSEIEKPLDGQQQITGSYGNQAFVMDAWVQADENEVNIALFNSFGVDMGELSFWEDGVSFSSTVFPPALKAEYIAADVQFCFYRVDSLMAALKKCGLTLIVEIHDGMDGWKEVRKILSGKKELIEIEKTETTISYTNFLRGYAYTLRGAF